MNRILRPATIAAAAALALSITASVPAAAAGNSYMVTNLVSDGSVSAMHVDPNLVNPWGLVFNPTAFAWVANNHTGTSTLYDGNGVPQSLVVTVPGPDGAVGAPTGIVYSASASDFMVTNGTTSGPSRFIYAGEDGIISGWAPNVDGTHALIAVMADAIYKGLALAAGTTGNQLYATDFHNNKVDVYDHNFNRITSPGGFKDPLLPKKYAPFGIQNVGGNLLVTFAKQDADAEDEMDGRGMGFVDFFDPDGNLLNHVARKVLVNAPWGIALAPPNFGRFSNDLLVGNFGDGTISAYDTTTGAYLGQLNNPDGTRLRIDRLWAIQFGNGFDSQPTNTLFFTAGPGDESGGLYGRVDAANP
jgi:uncharacterized protein (TIGR03118 family)